MDKNNNIKDLIRFKLIYFIRNNQRSSNKTHYSNRIIYLNLLITFERLIHSTLKIKLHSKSHSNNLESIN